MHICNNLNLISSACFLKLYWPWYYFRKLFRCTICILVHCCWHTSVNNRIVLTSKWPPSLFLSHFTPSPPWCKLLDPPLVIRVGTGGHSPPNFVDWGAQPPPNLDLQGLIPQHVICNSACIATSWQHLYTHKSQRDELNLASIAQHFISFNDRRMHTFGTFD